MTNFHDRRMLGDALPAGYLDPDGPALHRIPEDSAQFTGRGYRLQKLPRIGTMPAFLRTHSRQDDSESPTGGNRATSSHEQHPLASGEINLTSPPGTSRGDCLAHSPQQSIVRRFFLSPVSLSHSSWKRHGQSIAFAPRAAASRSNNTHNPHPVKPCISFSDIIAARRRKIQTKTDA